MRRLDRPSTFRFFHDLYRHTGDGDYVRVLWGANGEKVDLQFRSYSNKLSVAKWWWVDAKGKRVGQKQKG